MELKLLESLGRGGWLNATSGKYIDLHFDVHGLTHDEFVVKHPDVFGDDPMSVFGQGWVRITYPETYQRDPGQSPWLGVEGSPEFVKSQYVHRFVNRFIKEYDVDSVDVQLIDPQSQRSAGHGSFQMPHELSKLNAFLR